MKHNGKQNRNPGEAYMSNATRLRMEAQNEDNQNTRAEAEFLERNREAEARRQAKKEPLVLNLRESGSGGHHCPAANSKGRTHRATPQCIKQKHFGAYPRCRTPCSPDTGCSECSVKGQDLRFDNLTFPVHPQAKPLVQNDRYGDDVKPYSAGKEKRNRGSRKAGTQT